MLSTFVQALMSAEADAICGDPLRQQVRGADQLPQRLPDPDFDTRAGTLDVAVPKCLVEQPPAPPVAGTSWTATVRSA
jgi:putative transposase